MLRFSSSCVVCISGIKHRWMSQLCRIPILSAMQILTTHPSWANISAGNFRQGISKLQKIWHAETALPHISPVMVAVWQSSNGLRCQQTDVRIRACQERSHARFPTGNRLRDRARSDWPELFRRLRCWRSVYIRASAQAEEPCALGHCVFKLRVHVSRKYNTLMEQSDGRQSGIQIGCSRQPYGLGQTIRRQLCRAL